MTELELRKKAINTAKSYIGVKESDGSHKQIIDIYNKIRPIPRGYKMRYEDPWCAAFIGAISEKCGFLSIMPAECSCPQMIDLYKKMGRWEENDAYDAEIGDLIFYDWQDNGVGDNTGVADHVGIVAEKSGDNLTIIEGNMNDSVGTRTIRKNSKFIRGFGLPAYFVMSDKNPIIPVVDAEDVVQVVPNDAVNQTTICNIPLPQIKYGDGLNNPNPVVEAAQIILIGRRFPCGAAGHDGEFGNGTLTAVKNYQLANGLYADGIIGDKTWRSLLGLK